MFVVVTPKTCSQELPRFNFCCETVCPEMCISGFYPVLQVNTKIIHLNKQETLPIQTSISFFQKSVSFD